MTEPKPINLMIEREDETLRVRVQQRLRDAIIDGHFQPGQKLIERELTTLTGVSRSIIREALAHLAARGLIEHIAFRGYIVSRLNTRAVREIYQLRGALEGLAAELFAQNASPADLEALKAALGHLKATLQSGDSAQVRQSTTEFYDVLLEGAGNLELESALAPYRERIFLLRGRSISRPERRSASALELEQICAALERRDGPAAAAATRRHVSAALDAVLHSLDEDD